MLNNGPLKIMSPSAALQIFRAISPLVSPPALVRGLCGNELLNRLDFRRSAEHFTLQVDDEIEVVEHFGSTLHAMATPYVSGGILRPHLAFRTNDQVFTREDFMWHHKFELVRNGCASCIRWISFARPEISTHGTQLARQSYFRRTTRPLRCRRVAFSSGLIHLPRFIRHIQICRQLI
jgi:hypothetical protein